MVRKGEVKQDGAKRCSSYLRHSINLWDPYSCRIDISSAIVKNSGKGGPGKKEGYLAVNRIKKGVGERWKGR